MISVTRLEKEQLDAVGLLKYKKDGYRSQDQNFAVTNKEHVGRNKRYYVVEEFDVLAFLEIYDTLNLQRIRPDQLESLKKAGLVGEDKIQESGKYVPGALVYISRTGQARIKKVGQLMKFLKIWK